MSRKVERGNYSLYALHFFQNQKIQDYKGFFMVSKDSGK